MDADLKRKLESALISHDAKTNESAYALALYLKALDEAESAVDAGESLAAALYDNFSDRVLAVLERAAKLPRTFGGGGKDRGRPE